MAIHRDLIDSELHEPKGVAGASVNQIYVADGVGSGSWDLLAAGAVSVSNPSYTSTNLNDALTEIFNVFGLVDGRFLDVSSPSTILLPVPFSCEITKIRMILGGAITTSDSTITVTRSDGAAMGTQVIAFSGSTEGTAYEFTPTGNATLTYPTHRYVKLVTDGASSTAQPLFIQAEITRV